MEYQEYPRMLYNVLGETKGVSSQEELVSCLAGGWSKEPFKLGEKDMKKNEILWHKAEIAKLDKELLQMEESEMVAQLKAATEEKEIVATNKPQEDVSGIQPSRRTRKNVEENKVKVE